MMPPNTTTTTTKSARSRFSSPMGVSSSPSISTKGATDSQRNFMKTWLEPPLQNKASFQEAGLMRAGVVENMAPLGALPKVGMLKKPSVPGDSTPSTSSVKRIVLKKSAPTKERRTTDDSSPQATPGESPDRESAEAGVTSPTQPFFPINGLDDEEDEDYMPQKTKSHSRNPQGNNSSVRQRPVRSGRRSSALPKSPTGSHHSPTPQPPTTTTTTAADLSHPVASPLEFRPPASLLNREPADKALADKAITLAVDLAISHYRYPTAWALRECYDKHSSDPRFVTMVEDVYHQRADSDTLREFGRLIEDKKREGKKGNTARYCFDVDADSVSKTHKPKHAPYSNLVTMDITPAKIRHEDAGGHVSKKAKLEGEGQLTNGTNGVNSIMIRGINSSGKKGSAVAAANANAIARASAGAGAGAGVPTPTKTKSPSKNRKGRSDSVSSSSTLSSLDDIPDDFESFLDQKAQHHRHHHHHHQQQQQADDDLGDGVSRPSAAAPNNAPVPEGSTRPISNAQKKAGSKKKRNVSPNPDRCSNTAQVSHQHQPHDSDMPAAVLANGSSHHHRNHNTVPKPAFTSRFAADSAVDKADYFVQEKQSKKAENKTLLESQSAESFTRIPLAAESSEPQLQGVPALATTEQSRSSRKSAPAPAPVLSQRAARAAKRNYEDASDSISPSSASFKADLDQHSTRNSRAATPSDKRATTKKQKTGLRVKTSPMKKKGTSAGIPRGSGERPSPVGGPPHDKDDNDDSCYTCGGSGELVCCDGCHYSFHFLCIDPPMDEGRMPEEWYCYECQSRYFPASFAGHRGAFGSLLDNVDKKNSRAFRLPKDIREFFEGVKTGQDGEYEEMTSAKPKTSKKGYDEPFDFFKVKNAEGNAVLCHCCHQGTAENRPIIPCSVCGLNWHLECLEPPLTIPPPIRNWRCPCHVEDALMERLAPAHKYRRIRNAPIIEQSYSRGLKNNGHIEIEEDDDDPADSVAHRDFGRVYRLPEKGIKLDFIARVHQNQAQALRAKSLSQSQSRPTFSIDEQQVALNLSQLARGGDNGVDQLVRALVAEATPASLAAMAQADASHIASGELNRTDSAGLQAMLAQIDSLRSGITRLLQKPSSSGRASGASIAVENHVSINSSEVMTQKDDDTEDSAMQVD